MRRARRVQPATAAAGSARARRMCSLIAHAVRARADSTAWLPISSTAACPVPATWAAAAVHPPATPPTASAPADRALAAATAAAARLASSTCRPRRAPAFPPPLPPVTAAQLATATQSAPKTTLVPPAAGSAPAAPLSPGWPATRVKAATSTSRPAAAQPARAGPAPCRLPARRPASAPARPAWPPPVRTRSVTCALLTTLISNRAWAAAPATATQTARPAPSATSSPASAPASRASPASAVTSALPTTLALLPSAASLAPATPFVAVGVMMTVRRSFRILIFPRSLGRQHLPPVQSDERRVPVQGKCDGGQVRRLRHRLLPPAGQQP